jgi:hypothetical protein
MGKRLSEDIDDLARLMRRHFASGVRPSLDGCAGLFAKLQGMAQAARALEARLDAPPAMAMAAGPAGDGRTPAEHARALLLAGMGKDGGGP